MVSTIVGVPALEAAEAADHQPDFAALEAVGPVLTKRGMPRYHFGDRISLGDGAVQTFVATVRGAPASLGVVFTASMLDNLPEEPFDGSTCFDVDGDGELNASSHPFECVGGHQRILFLPPQADQTPFSWFLLNWNPIGHDPPGIYTDPHFDFHFYIQGYVERSFIRPGPCGLVINCDDFVTATIPVPAPYLPAGYADVGAAEGRMGNHLIDLTAPEFQPGGMFSHTFIYGAYGGHISFWEPMISLATLEERSAEICAPIRQPVAYEVEGYYPTEYCIRYHSHPLLRSYTVSLEKFEYQPAS